MIKFPFPRFRSQALPSPSPGPGEDVVRMALQTVRGISRRIESGKTDEALGLLRGAWGIIQRKLLESPEPSSLHEAVAALVLSEYFKHEGDWEAMDKCLRVSAKEVLGLELT